MPREQRTPAYWAVVPAPVRHDKTLRPNAKLLYAEIQALADSCGYCWATNEYLAELFDIAARTVSDLISTLAKRGYITVEVLRDPKTNEVMERRIWVDKPATAETPPPAKNGDTPLADFGGTPPAKNGEENDYSSLSNNTPLTPQRGDAGKQPQKRPRRKLKAEPDWKPERFKAFWEYYSHHARGENKQGAIRAWDRLQPNDELIRVMGMALQQQVASDDWQRGIGIPYASTWLNNARWQDAPRQPAQEDSDEEGIDGI